MMKHCTILAILFTAVSLLTGCGDKLEIIPPKPTKLAAKGKGPALAIDHSPSAPTRRRSQQDIDGDLMREFDDDIAAWHRSYASQNQHVFLLEASLTRRAEEHYSELVRLLRGDNVPFAMVSASAVGFANRTQSRELLLEVAQSDRDERIIENALNGLAVLLARNPEVRARTEGSDISGFLSDSREGVRVAASFAAMNLVDYGDDRGLMPYLAERVGDDSYMVRANSCWAIGRAGGPTALNVLEVALLGDPTPEVRCNAALALAATGETDAVDILIEGLTAQEAEVRRHCSTALALMTGEEHGISRAAWLTWWASHRDGFVPLTAKVSSSGS